MKYVLKDLRALDRMLKENWFETDPIRIGAEQELCLVDSHYKVDPRAMEILARLNGSDSFTTEIAKFNLEVNLKPLEFHSGCLSDLHRNLLDRVQRVREIAQEQGGEVLLTGILPTIRKVDVDVKNMTPLQRYRALSKAMKNLRGGELELRIQGMEELLMKFDTTLLEACNTAFQIHLQVTPEEFVRKYNIAQAIGGPVLACAVGSPILFGKRLWSETRIALFYQSVDVRKVGDHLRDSSPRVTFGNEWVKEGILEIFQEDAARHRVMLSSEVNEDAEAMLDNGEPPELKALQVHNGTIYRWNRPCYGVADGKAHLRIENRMLPAGPTVIDQVANSAFWLGTLNSLEDYYPDISEIMEFDDAKMNFISAAKMGLDTSFRWVEGRRVNAVDLIRDELLPIAREGLEKAKVDSGDIDTYLGIIEERVANGQTTSHWMLNNYSRLMKDNGSREQTLATLTAEMIGYQKKDTPVHQWEPARIESMEHWEPSTLLVEEFMTTDLFTVQKDDILEFVANLIDWRKIRYIPVEDDDKQLVGLVTMRIMFREYSKAVNEDGELPESVQEIMIEHPTTVHPEASIMEALEIMEKEEIGCLPVVKNNHLVGLITEENYMTITGRLLKVLHENNG